MNAATLLADTGNIGLTVCAALDTAGVIAYWTRAHGGDGGKWWKTPFGVHLMCFMAAFAIVLDQSVIYLLTGPGLIVHAVPGLHPDWFTWERTASFAVLIPAVLAWRLYLILRPPRRLRETVMKRALTPSLNPTGLGSAAAAIYAAVVMIWNAAHHTGVINPQVIVAALGAAAFLYARFKVTPVADPKDGNGNPLKALPAPPPAGPPA